MVQFFDDYDEKYPDLILQILEYFSITNIPVREKWRKENHDLGPIYDFIRKDNLQPRTIEKICSKLCQLGYMERLRSSHRLAEFDDFISNVNITDDWKNSDHRKKLAYTFNSMVYGFNYVYNSFKQNVIPLLHDNIIDENTDKTTPETSVGSAFKLPDGIVTAKHCLEKAKAVAIKGFSGAELAQAKILTHKNPNVDIAFIQLNKTIDAQLCFFDELNLMDEILVMGYPQIPKFLDFLTAEKALISAKEKAKLIVSRGSAAATCGTIERTTLALITAKIQGGNSGGPVLNSKGAIVAVACADTKIIKGESYDDLGYGVVTPISDLHNLKNDPSMELTGKVHFRDFD